MFTFFLVKFSFGCRYFYFCINNNKNVKIRIKVMKWNWTVNHADPILVSSSLEFTSCDIDDVHSLNNSKFVDSIDRIYLIEFNMKETTETARSASYIDLHLKWQWKSIHNQNLRQGGIILICSLWIFLFCVATFQQHLQMK